MGFGRQFFEHPCPKPTVKLSEKTHQQTLYDTQEGLEHDTPTLPRLRGGKALCPWVRLQRCRPHRLPRSYRGYNLPVVVSRLLLSGHRWPDGSGWLGPHQHHSTEPPERQVISRPDALIVRLVAAPARVEMNPPDSRVWPISSGQRYVSAGTTVRVFTIKLLSPADPAEATRLTEKVTLLADVLVTVNLSMIVLQLVAVYCVVWLFSACLRGMMFLTVTVMG
jgi:hypothetical protein